MKKRLLPSVFFISFYCTVAAQVWSPKAAGVLPANYGIDDICIVSDQVIWATANSGPTPVPASYVAKLLRSTDGGETWVVKDIEEAMGRFCWDIHAFDENTACLTTTNRGSGNKQGIFRTTDGGETWTEVFNHAAGGTWLHFFDGQEGLCFQGTDIARTTNSGLNWALVPGANIPDYLPGEGWGGASLSNSVGTFGNAVWFGTSKGRVFKTDSRGQNWTAHNTGLGANSFLYSFGFIDEKNGLGVFDIAGVAELARTTDGGLSWTKTGNFDFTVVDAIPCANTFMGASYNAGSERTAFSTNHGTSWTVRDASLAANTHVFVSPELGWTANVAAVGNGPALYKWAGGSLDTRIYVNKNATGANTGASWADAYTDLQVALTGAQAGDEIWVAEGTYKTAAPGGSPTSTFLINKDLKLYGGFAGTECNLSERDVLLHPSVLSGDLNGNDVPDDFTQNRSDNVTNVVRINANFTDDALLDGFTIEGGQADGSGSSPFDRTGGGVYCLGSPTFRGCVFRQNFALTQGGGLYLWGAGAQGCLVNGCRFEKNRAARPDSNAQGGGMYAYNVKGVGFTVSNCVFTGNWADWVGGLEAANSNGTVDGSTFTNNSTPRHGGGMRVFTQAGTDGLHFSVSNCAFEDNKASFGGGLYLLIFSKNCSLDVAHCQFKGNAAEEMNLTGWGQGFGGFGGGFASGADNGSITVEDCLFEGNSSSVNKGGAGIFSEGNGAKCRVSRCTFFQNKTAYNGSGFHLESIGKNMDFQMKACQFTGNMADSASAAADFWGNSGGSGTVAVDSCVFENNTSYYSGGVEMGNGYAGGATINYSLTNSTFKNNHAAEGGAVTLWCDAGSKANFLVENCLIDGNSASVLGGGLLFGPLSTDFHATIKRSKILHNQSKSGGAFDMYQFFGVVPFPQNASLLFANCLIAGNTSDNAAIAADSLPNLQFLNCTIAGNSGGGIQLSDQSGLRLQNTILHNPGFLNYEALTADVSYTSGGGNLSGDLSLSVTSTDQMNLDPLFAGGGDYHLKLGSPCIDKGVDLGNLPATDLDGGPRVFGNGVDVGAYESPFTSSAREVIAGEVAVSPNPAVAFLNIQLPEATAGQFEVEVFDVQGRLLRRQSLAADGGQRLDVQGLAAGMYALKVVVGERVYVGRFVKQ